MPEHNRTVFATLLRARRNALKLTQATLAARTEALRDAGKVPRAITDRTISDLERAAPSDARIPHQATARTLAIALELEPGSADYDTFIAAAQDPTMPRVPPSPRTDPDAEFLAAGREPQLARLEAAIISASKGQPSVVVLTGDAGIGKSRLLAEACRLASDRHRGTVVLWGTSPRDFGGMSGQEPWRAIVAQMLRDPIATEGALPADNADRIATRLPLVARALAGHAAPLVGRLVATDALQHPALLAALPPELSRQVGSTAPPADGLAATTEDIAAAFVRLLETYASAGPVVLVLEDLHWAGAATLATARYVVTTLAERRLPIALLASLRTGDGPLTSDAAAFLDVVADAFPDAAIDLKTTVGGDAGRAFVDAAVARLQLESLAERLYERTSGMPLFVMSFLRLHAQDATAVTGRNIPAELEAVFARQLARLDARGRVLLAAASVQGDTFLAEPALAVAGLPEAGYRWLDETLASQVRFVGPLTVAPGVTMRRYRFTHTVLRDHVTHTLSHLERSHLHLATAEMLESTLGPRDHDAIETIAIHFEQGGDLARAASRWLAAGDRAMFRSNHHHALEIFHHIREMDVASVAPEVHVQALVGIGNCLRAVGRPAEARQALQHARREAVRKQLHTIDANALTSLGVLDFDAGRMVAGAARFAQAIEAYTRAGNLEEAARGNGNLSLALHGMGRYDDARARAGEAILLAQEAGSAAALASGRIALTNCWLDLGYYERAIEHYEAGLALNDAGGLIHYGNICLLNIALCYIELGRWDDAEATLDRLDDPERRLVERVRSVLAFNRALIAEGLGDHEAARRGFDESRAIRQRIGQERLLADSLAGLLRVAAVTGDSSGTNTLIADLEEHLADQGLIGIEHLGRLHLAMFDGYRATGDEKRAMAWLSDAVALLGERADRLADPAHRESYLTRPPSHRQLIELARRHGIPVPEPASPPD